MGYNPNNPTPNPNPKPGQIQFCEHDVLIVVGHSHFFRTMFQVRGRVRVMVRVAEP